MLESFSTMTKTIPTDLDLRSECKQYVGILSFPRVLKSTVAV